LYKQAVFESAYYVLFTPRRRGLQRIAYSNITQREP
jgi:hypothetical protein